MADFAVYERSVLANPTGYSPEFDFNGYQGSNPNKPLPGSRLANELDNIATAIGSLKGAVEDIRRSDGKLQNESVTEDSLASDILAPVNSKLDKEISGRLASDVQESTARIAGDKALASLVGQAGPIQVPFFDTATAAALATIKPGIMSIQTGGDLVAGDGGGGTWRRVGTGALVKGRFKDFSSTDRWEACRTPDGRWNARQFGMRDDNGTTNNDTGWNGLLTVAPPGDTVVFRNNEAKRWSFTATSTSYPYVVEVDDGTTFFGPNIDNVRFTTVTRGKLALECTGDSFWKRPYERFPDPGNGIKQDWISADEYDDSTSIALYPNNHLTVQSTAVNSNNWSAQTVGITVIPDAIAWDTSVMTPNYWSIAFDNRPEVGALYSAGSAADGVLPINALVVRVEDGYVCYYQGNSPMEIRRSTLNAGATNAVVELVRPITADNIPAYNWRYSSLGVYINEFNEYCIVQNGVLIDGPRKAPGSKPITHIGWGFLLPNPIPAGGYGYTMFTKTRKAQPPAPRPQKLLFLGDSLTDPYVQPGWPDYVAAMMQGSNGVQITGVENRAISGWTSSQVLADMNNIGNIDHTLAFCMVGTNDQRANVNNFVFKQNLQAILTKLKAANLPVVFVSNHCWYGRAEAALYGGRGIEVSLAELGSKFRDTVLQTVAEWRALNPDHRVGVVDFSRVVPPSLPQWLTWAQTGSRVDGVLTDNVHPTERTRSYLGRAVARKAMQLLAPKSRRSVQPQPIPSSWCRNTWAPASDWQSIWWIDDTGVKHLRIFLLTTSTNASDYADGATILKLPGFLAPSSIYIGGSSYGQVASGAYMSAASGNTRVDISTDGEVKCYGVNAAVKWVVVELSFS